MTLLNDTFFGSRKCSVTLKTCFVSKPIILPIMIYLKTIINKRIDG